MAAIWKKRYRNIRCHATRLLTASFSCETPQLILRTPFYKIDVAQRTHFKPLCFQKVIMNRP